MMSSMTITHDKNLGEPSDVRSLIGASLKQHRIAAQMTQEALAFAAEVDRTFVSDIERGNANPSVLTLAGLCYALGITLADLFASVKIAAPPDMGASRRANAAQPVLKPRKGRLR
jgi:transcriptional regulator with XRE-family HTH domain